MKPYVFFLASETLESSTISQLDSLMDDERLCVDYYTCEGPPEQCDDNPDGNYCVAILTSEEARTLQDAGIEVEEIPWEGRKLDCDGRLCSWGNLDSPELLFPLYNPAR